MSRCLRKASCVFGRAFRFLRLLSQEEGYGYGIVTQVALGFIAFVIGNEFRLGALKSMGRQAIAVGVLQAVVTTALVDVALFDFLGRLVDLTKDVPAPDFFARHGRELLFMAFVALIGWR